MTSILKALFLKFVTLFGLKTIDAALVLFNAAIADLDKVTTQRHAAVKDAEAVVEKLRAQIEEDTQYAAKAARISLRIKAMLEN